MAIEILAAAALACTLSGSDAAWMRDLTEAWRTTSREVLLEEPRPLPWIVFFDETCAWQLKPGAAPTGAAHGGTLTLPDGNTAPARLAAFVSTMGDDETPFLVMAMPSLWRAAPQHAGETTLPQLMRAVFVHEMMHTRQASGIGGRIGAVERQFGLPPDFDDDIVQTRFAERPGFREAYERERDLLFQAAAATDVATQRALAASAVAAMRARRAIYFTGADAIVAELEDIFLGMEGIGQFVAYRSAQREGMAPADALAFIRRGGRYWSQDEGLAAFLVIDALLPGWQARVLGSTLPGVLDLLGEAARVR